ncbi:uncharacterized protein LOC135120732 [Zophobas morio]|uniref:uncharacterized protein LOC135120732 n=1 Tax=Zophobas morio TaxID=2755281 RepID=UPI00308326B5
MVEYSSLTVLCCLLILSCFYLTQSSILCSNAGVCTGTMAYAVSVGVVSTFATAVLLLIQFFMSDKPKIIDIVASVFLFVWWAAGTGVGTFEGPYTNFEYANGYLSSWIALVVSVYYFFLCCGSSFRKISLEHDSVTAVIGVLLISTLFYIIASAVQCNNYYCGGYIAYAIAVGSVGFILTIFLLILKICKIEWLYKIGKYIAGFLILWFAIGTGIATFKAPFPRLGNGYFGAWVSFLCSLFLFSMLVPELFGARQQSSSSAQQATVGESQAHQADSYN